MIDLMLFAGRIVLVILLFLFLLAVTRTGIGLVRGQRHDAAIWSVDVEKGSRALRGLHVDMLGPVIIGRSPSCTLVLDDSYASSRHARVFPKDGAWWLEDLGSTNGTMMDGRPVHGAVELPMNIPVRIGQTTLELRS